MSTTKNLDVITELKDDSKYYGEFGKQYLSASDIGTLLNNPSEFKKDKTPTIPMLQGVMFHQLILEPNKDVKYHVVDTSTRTTKHYKDYINSNEIGKAYLQKEVVAVESWVDVVKNNFLIYDLITQEGNQYEVPSIGEIMGTPFKGKADIVGDKVYDLKTTSDISQFRWSAKKYNYDSQAYIYRELFNKDMVFIVVDKYTNQLGIFECSDDFYENGKDKVERAIHIWDLYFSPESKEDINERIIYQTL